jgi:hypothetical protein
MSELLSKSNLTRIALTAGAVAIVGAVATAAVAIGTFALGAFAIRKLISHRKHLIKLSVGELSVDHLIVKNSTPTHNPPASS